MRGPYVYIPGVARVGRTHEQGPYAAEVSRLRLLAHLAADPHQGGDIFATRQGAERYINIPALGRHELVRRRRFLGDWEPVTE